ncbi:isotrichodermin C-15 hydroxylase [Apiospora saccharicola]|uniref:Isotrichodermin C-15 hydroxylase n=1 Tax=Apiospora saccharicola TaxID=335842 RepID=A0ABR1TL54_9PEZI
MDSITALLEKNERVVSHRALGAITALVLIYRVVTAVYRLYIHPLSKVPGPKLYAVSSLPFEIQSKIKGTFVRDTTALHKKYGPVVRVSPDRVAVDGSVGWPAFTRRGQEELGKIWQFYGFGPLAILGAGQDAHKRQRRVMAHATSPIALADQEVYLQKQVNKFVDVLSEHADQDKPIDIMLWFNYLTFDIVGELTLGTSLGCLDSRDSVHPLVGVVTATTRDNARRMFLTGIPLLGSVIPMLTYILRKKEIDKILDMQKHMDNQAEERIALGMDTRSDLITYMLRANAENKGKGMSHEEMLVNTRVLLLAGGETTATALSGFAFHMTNDPVAYQTLADEVRGAFSSAEDITIRATSQLPYLCACIEETLRMYPPAADMPPRVSPGADVGGYYLPKGTIVSVYQWATHHSAEHFADAESFAPQRWLPPTHPLYETKFAGDNKAVCKPFSAGPRDCTGKILAYAEMRLAIARLLWHFDFVREARQDDWIASQHVFTLAEKGPLMIGLRRRAYLV